MASIANCSAADAGVSVVIPVRNGARWLPEVLDALARECRDLPHEILVVDDGSSDDSITICRCRGMALRVLDGPARGAAAAVNAGIRHARFPFIAQVDQDVVVESGWLATLLHTMSDGRVAAAQGWYVTDAAAPRLARTMAMDLEQRYARIADGFTDHVCTGNVLWRRAAIEAVGLLDEALGYGYDNDLSYRLAAAGYTLRICREARSLHRWRDGIGGYLAQQYGFGYGRLDLIARHRTRVGGDAVSPASMMAHPIVMAVALSMLAGGIASWLADRAAAPWLAASAAALGALAAERGLAGARAWRRWHDPAAWLFPPVHLLRDLAWVAAIACWCGRRIAGRAPSPAHSMRPRPAERSVPVLAEDP